MKPLLYGSRKPNFGHVNSKAGRNYYPAELEKYEEKEIIEEILREVNNA